MILDTLTVDATTFAADTGWEPKPQGLCRGEVCVPAPGSLADDDTVDVEVAARHLGMPLVHDPQHGIWALGPATVGGRALDTAVAANPALVDHRGEAFDFTSLRGRKVILVAWASW